MASDGVGVSVSVGVGVAGDGASGSGGSNGKSSWGAASGFYSLGIGVLSALNADSAISVNIVVADIGLAGGGSVNC